MAAITAALASSFVLLLAFLPSSQSTSPAARTLRQHSISSHLHHKARRTSSGAGAGLFEVKYFTQTLDHFNYLPASYATFQQRYLVNATHWGGAAALAPIFVYAGNEGDIDWFAENTGLMFEAAPRFKALLVFIEHRYYGESKPFSGGGSGDGGNASTLGYLSSEQALADYAALIVDLKKNLSAEGSPVVAFGGSYGGLLAGWLRLKYPHVVLGALASSAPFLQFDDITSPYSFNDIVTRDFRGESESCYEVIKSSWKEIEIAMKTKEGAKELRDTFKVCDGQDVEYIGSWLATAYSYAAMTDYPTPSNFLAPLPAFPVREMCKAIDRPPAAGTFERLYGAMNVYYNYTGETRCMDIYQSEDPHGMALWYWQACTEVVLTSGGSSNDSMFIPYVYNLADYIKDCKTQYGVEPRPHWLVTEYGGHDVRRVLKRFASNIIFFNGLRDPWSGGGILKSISRSLVAIVAPEGAHHVDLRFSSKEDPKWLQEVRKRELRIIAEWIEEYYRDANCD